MNLLDENIRHDQGQQLRKWRIPFRLLIRDLARSGIQDATEPKKNRAVTSLLLVGHELAETLGFAPGVGGVAWPQPK